MCDYLEVNIFMTQNNMLPAYTKANQAKYSTFLSEEFCHQVHVCLFPDVYILYMVYGSECWALRKQEEQRLHTTEMKMLRWSQGKTRKDRIKNETIRGIARVTPIKSVLAQKRLSWYGHVMRREETHITRSTLNMTVMGTRPRGRPKMRWLDRLKSDMRSYGINPEMATDRERWAVMVKHVDTT